MTLSADHPAGTVVCDALALGATLTCAIAAALLLCTPALLHAMAPAMSPEVLAYAADYVRIRALGLPASVAYTVLQAYFLACRAPRGPMLATAVASVVNLVGDILLCQGFGWGVAGAAAATTGARHRLTSSCWDWNTCKCRLNMRWANTANIEAFAVQRPIGLCVCCSSCGRARPCRAAQRMLATASPYVWCCPECRQRRPLWQSLGLC